VDQLTSRLKNRRALVTGAAGGIGGAVARLFSREGADVALVDIDKSGLIEKAKDIGEAHPDRQLEWFVGDISNEQQCKRFVIDAVQALNGIDILINCAAARMYQPLAESSQKDWENILRVNILGTQNVTKFALDYLRQSSAASIINVSSVFAMLGRRGMGQYDATKAAIISMTRTFAAEEAANGIRVNAVCPGSTWTAYTASRGDARKMSEKELHTNGAAPSLLNRWAEPDEIAYPILWLASHEASFITGTCLMVDGGLSAAMLS